MPGPAGEVPYKGVWWVIEGFAFLVDRGCVKVRSWLLSAGLAVRCWGRGEGGGVGGVAHYRVAVAGHRGRNIGHV